MDGKHFSAHGDWTNMKPKKRVELKHPFSAKLIIKSIDTLTASEVKRLSLWLHDQFDFLSKNSAEIAINYKATFEV